MDRCGTVARWFGQSWPMSPSNHRPALLDVDKLLPAPGRIVMLSGPSGSGKSTLLRRLRRRLRRRCIDLNRITLPRRPVVELFGQLSLEEALRLLSRVGLAEAQTYLLEPRRLSTGQRWRLRLAMALAEARRRAGEVCIVCDEFAAPLDQITAIVVSHALRRVVDGSGGLSAIVATGRDELRRALRPDVWVECDFGEVRVR